MANTNKVMNGARAAKKDEFYTQLEDIEKEFRFYGDRFSGKTVYCNCDDPHTSNFFKYFVANFNNLGLKSLIATHFVEGAGESKEDGAGTLFDLGESVKDAEEEDPEESFARKAVVTNVPKSMFFNDVENMDVDYVLSLPGNSLYALKGDGDFRSEECLELLDKADIVATNPPFSLFREFISVLVERNKDFAIVGNQNAVTYKNIFPHFASGNFRFGPSIHAGDRKFYIPDNYPLGATICGVDKKGKRFVRVAGVRWFTNMDPERMPDNLILTEKFSPEKFPTYSNYGAISVMKTKEIPMDYTGLMGVPITFLDKHRPERFEIVDLLGVPGINGKKLYKRIIIRHKDGLATEKEKESS